MQHYYDASFSLHCIRDAYFKQIFPELDLERSTISVPVLYYSFLCSILFGWFFKFCAQFVLFIPNVSSNLSLSPRQEKSARDLFILNGECSGAWFQLTDSAGGVQQSHHSHPNSGQRQTAKRVLISNWPSELSKNLKNQPKPLSLGTGNHTLRLQQVR